MKNLLVDAKNVMQEIDYFMELGWGTNDEGLATIGLNVGVTFEQVKAYIQSF